MKKKVFFNPGLIIPVAVTFAVIIIAVTAMDIYQSYKDIYQSKTEEAVSLLRVVQKSGENAYMSSIEMESLITANLINNAYLISLLEEREKINTQELSRISKANGVDHIYLFSADANLELANSNQAYSELNIPERYSSEIDSIITGKYDYFAAGSVPDSSGRLHLLVLHKRSGVKNGIIAISVESAYLLEFRKRMGVGRLLQKIAAGKDIEYIAIQDSTGIITASMGVENLSSFESDKFLSDAAGRKGIYTREAIFNDSKILEAVKPFKTGDEISGIIRIGVSLGPVRDLIYRTILRSIVISFMFLLVGTVVIIYIANTQSYATLKSEYRKAQSYTEKILENMSDAVVVADINGSISLLNKSAESIFGVKYEDVKGKDCRYLIHNEESFIEKALRAGEPVEYAEHAVKTAKGISLIIGGSTSIIYNDLNNIEAVVAVLRDVTAQRNFEEVQKRQEKLSAMGELAAGVAHEIKNPLNLIGITAQRLEREFKPVEDEQEYSELIKNMKLEVRRVTDIINQFLKFAKPPKLNKSRVNIKEFFESIVTSFRSHAAENNIILISRCDDLEAEIDAVQMRQVLVNLIQNSFDAVKEGGEVSLEAFRSEDCLVMRVKDNGSGISEEDMKKIFNIYFTTKSYGTGLGLSIVTQIVSEHKGLIKVSSSAETGSIFTIELPLK